MGHWLFLFFSWAHIAALISAFIPPSGFPPNSIFLFFPVPRLFPHLLLCCPVVLCLPFEVFLFLDIPCIPCLSFQSLHPDKQQQRVLVTWGLCENFKASEISETNLYWAIGMPPAAWKSFSGGPRRGANCLSNCFLWTHSKSLGRSHLNTKGESSILCPGEEISGLWKVNEKDPHRS